MDLLFPWRHKRAAPVLGYPQQQQQQQARNRPNDDYPQNHQHRRQPLDFARRRGMQHQPNFLIPPEEGNGTNGENFEDDGHRGGFLGMTLDLGMMKNPITVSPLRQMLDALNMAIVPHENRLSTLLLASELLNHHDRRRHEYELREGAAHILYQKLALVLTLRQSHYEGSNSLSNSLSNRVYGELDRRSSSDASYYLRGSNNRSWMSSRRRRNDETDRSPDASDADYEIALLVGCLEMVHRAGSEAIAHTWADIGKEAMPLLVRVMERPFRKIEAVVEKAERQMTSASHIERAISIAANRERKLAVQKVTKIFAIYSLVPEAKVSIAAFPGLLSILVKITDTRNMNRMTSRTRPTSFRNSTNISNNHLNNNNIDGAKSINDNNTTGSNATYPTKNRSSDSQNIPPLPMAGANGCMTSPSGLGLYMTEASRFNAIATLTNLAAAEPNRMLMLAEPGLLDNISRVVHNERSDVARQCSALAIMNLSNGDREHVPELAGNDLLLATLIELMKDDEERETRRNAAIALFNVACADQNTVKLVRYRDGLILDTIVRIVKTDPLPGAPPDEDGGARLNAVEALFNISCSSIPETTDRVAAHPDLLRSLATTLRSSHSGTPTSVRIYCAATLRRMSELLHAPSRSHHLLLPALAIAGAGGGWTRTPCIAEALLMQAKNPRNRKAMIEEEGILDALAKMSLCIGGEEERIRSAGLETIELLCLEEGEDGNLMRKMAYHQGVVMALTRATYAMNAVGGNDGKVEEGELNRDDTSYMAGSVQNGEHRQSQDNNINMPGSARSGQQRRIQDTLKKLVEAM